jgi:hypothetical protein
MACVEVEQLPRHPWFAAFELMDECFIGHCTAWKSSGCTRVEFLSLFACRL